MIFNLKRLPQLLRFANRATMQRLDSAFIIWRLDYCNSTFAGLPACGQKPLQCVLHAAVQIVAGLGPRDHVTEHMKELHWLPIAYRIKFKQCTLMHSVKVPLTFGTFSYLSLIFHAAHVVALLHQDSMVLYSRDPSSVAEHSP